ncbi:MAG: hypothetical protein NZ958_03100 [Bacteroidia bacterium]|nr:hypothetical protein [Bacteroidia bacterium]
MLRQTAGTILEEQVARVKEEVRLWSAGGEQTDDILLIGLEV